MPAAGRDFPCLPYREQARPVAPTSVEAIGRSVAHLADSLDERSLRRVPAYV